MVTENYKTRELAEAAIKAHKGKLRHKAFCPLIKSKCRPDCVSYVKPYVVGGTRSGYKIYPAYCNMPLIIGQVEVWKQN